MGSLATDPDCDDGDYEGQALFRAQARIGLEERDPDKWPEDCFHIPTDALANLHPFPAVDSRIRYEDKDHVYFVDGEQMPISSTALVGSLFEPFDSAKILASMRPENRAKYGDRSDSDIIAEWRASGDAAAQYGTRAHAMAETYFNTGFLTRCPELRPVADMFVNFLRGFFYKHSLVPVRTEFLVFVPKVMGGSVDLLAQSTKTGEYFILDYKFCKGDFRDSFNKFCTIPWLARYRIPDSKLGHYSLQLHIYRYALMQLGFPVIPARNLYLVVFHPSNPGYQVIQCLDYSFIVPKLFEPQHAQEIVAIYRQRKKDAKNH